MNLKLKRQWLTPQSTGGELFIEDKLECFTLELPIRDGKPGSAIPPGTYRVTVEPSPRFKRDMPRLHGIPGRSGILIHWGNYAGDIPSTPAMEESDTEGCILVGQIRSSDFVGRSRAAFDVLFSKMSTAIAQDQQCAITITEPPPEMGVEESIGG